MDTLPAALAWAARGFRIFPVVAGTKNPAIENWPALATSDPVQIERWWNPPNSPVREEFNIGVCTTDLVVLDADQKDGKNGLASFAELDCDFNTLVVRTPSGGCHFYYSGANVQNAVELLPGLDVRSRHGYVLAPGSRTVAGTYTVELDNPVATVSAQVRSLCERSLALRSQAVVGVAELDTPSALTAASHFLQHTAPLAIEGAGGDDTTYKVICRLRDLGVSNETAVVLLATHWNPRCSPPWDPDELEGKVENAYTYATGTPGQATAEAFLHGVSVTPAPPIADEPEPVLEELAFGNALPAAMFKPRPWVMAGLLLRRSVTTLISPGGAGKSTFALTLAAHVVLGLAFLGFASRIKGKAVIYNAEDDREEQSKRLFAICAHFGFDYGEVASRICLLSSEDVDLQFTTMIEGVETLNTKAVTALANFLADPDVVLFAGDPYIELFASDINDNAAQKTNMAILRSLARRADIAVLISHHTRKPYGNSSMAGDAAASMGASAIINSARINLTLITASSADCERYSIREEDRHDYVRLDSAKANLTKQGGEPIWLRRDSVPVPGGDDIGVLKGHDLVEDALGVAAQMARLLHAHMVAANTAELPMAEAIAAVMSGDPLCSKLMVGQVKSRIENCLTRSVTLEGGERVQLRSVKNRKVVVID